MIPPKINIKTTVSDTEVPKYNKLTKQLLMASCTGDLKGFPQVSEVQSRLSCYNNNHGKVDFLNAFWSSLQCAVNRVFILDSYFLKPEAPSNADKAKLISERVLVIKEKLEETILGSAEGLEIKILTDSPYAEDKEKEQEMLASFKEVEDLAQELGQQGNTGIKLSVCLELTRKFNYIHDRFAIIDNELWHFGGTVGGFNSKLSAASRGWDAEALNAISFFNEVWQKCTR